MNAHAKNLSLTRRNIVGAHAYGFNTGAGSPPASPEDAAQFSDVSPSSGYATGFGRLAKTDISRGYSSGTFRPRNRAPRDEVVAFLWRWTREV